VPVAGEKQFMKMAYTSVYSARAHVIELKGKPPSEMGEEVKP
jgi:hypothetical protein